VAGRQVAILRYDGKVTRDLTTTDENGVVAVAVGSGGMFLLNAVDYRPTQEDDAVWESHWASLTFGLPVVLPPPHPLDPLSRQEIARTIGVIGRSGHATASTRAALVTLAEPTKAEVLAWVPGTLVNRHAFALIRNDATLYEAEVDLVAGKLERWTEVADAQPPVQSTEWDRAQRALKADSRWLAAMRLRGYDDVTQIFCDSLTIGFFDDPAYRGRRLIKMPCYDLAGTSTNVYGRPIEGVIGTVDLNSGEVVEVVDKGVVPISSADHGFASTGNSQARPARDTAPGGSKFTRDRYLVSWRGWSFHVGFDQRFGAVVSLVRHRDEGEPRLVLYQGHVSEVFVPYMDGDQGWYFRSYMDVGEYGLGALSSPLQPGTDCPDDADYIDVDLVTPVGGTYVRERVVCLFERDTAAPLWRHWEALNGAYAGRSDSELVVRSIPSIGNYDYIVDWVFTRKGEIRIDVGATGIDAVKGVAVRHMDEPGADEATRTGMLVAPNLVAVHHDHYLSLRLDLDVDGQINSFVRQRLTPVSLPAGHPRRSLWRLQTEPAPTETALAGHAGPELWRVENPASKTTLGHRRSYQIAAGHAATSLLSDDDWPQRRAPFSSQTLWVTAWHPDERFAAGPYPNQSPGGAGLPVYVDGEAIEATDVVAWYTIGFHHLTRPEDWPVLPTVWHSVRLRPYGFFARNPDVEQPAN
jgi:primary-amine oxidase